MTDPVVEVARKTTQVGVLEARIAELKAELDGERAECARKARHVGTLRGLLKGALRENALSPEYRALAETAMARLDGERPLRDADFGPARIA